MQRSLFQRVDLEEATDNENQAKDKALKDIVDNAHLYDPAYLEDCTVINTEEIEG